MNDKPYKSLNSDQVEFYKKNGYLLTAKPLFTDQKFQELYRIFTDLSMVRDHHGNAQHKVYHCRGENHGNNPLITL